MSGIVKERLTAHNNFRYRSMDGVLSRPSPILAKHKLARCRRSSSAAQQIHLSEDGHFLVSVVVIVAIGLISADHGSTRTIEAFGEALDGGDKGAAKEMQSPYKCEVLRTFGCRQHKGGGAHASSH